MYPVLSNLRTVVVATAAVLCASALSSCGPKNNTLTKQEIADGWELLFNGEPMVDLYDDIIGAGQGRIALQIHDGGGIKVLWRNFHLTTL